MIDVVEEPKKPTAKELRHAAKKLPSRVAKLVTKDTPIILISVSVYKAAFKPLQNSDFNLVDIKISFPSTRKIQGQEKSLKEQFLEELPNALQVVP